MRLGRLIMVVAMACGLSACTSKFKTYDGPPVTEVQVHKAERKMYLISGNQVLKSYDVALGQRPEGDKLVEGDARTPEGSYMIDKRNPNSDYHLSIGISYPNEEDRETALALGRRPGGDIFIHGANGKGRNKGDWTWGCIAVTNKEIEDVYAMVRDGTPIHIFPSAAGPAPDPLAIDPALTTPADPAAAPVAPPIELAQLPNADVVGTTVVPAGVTP
jgi:L,D-transpeptidase catalytic domain